MSWSLTKKTCLPRLKDVLEPCMTRFSDVLQVQGNIKALLRNEDDFIEAWSHFKEDRHVLLTLLHSDDRLLRIAGRPLAFRNVLRCLNSTREFQNDLFDKMIVNHASLVLTDRRDYVETVALFPENEDVIFTAFWQSCPSKRERAAVIIQCFQERRLVIPDDVLIECIVDHQSVKVLIEVAMQRPDLKRKLLYVFVRDWTWVLENLGRQWYAFQEAFEDICSSLTSNSFRATLVDLKTKFIKIDHRLNLRHYFVPLLGVMRMTGQFGKFKDVLANIGAGLYDQGSFEERHAAAKKVLEEWRMFCNLYVSRPNLNDESKVEDVHTCVGMLNWTRGRLSFVIPLSQKQTQSIAEKVGPEELRTLFQDNSPKKCLEELYFRPVHFMNDVRRKVEGLGMLSVIELLNKQTPNTLINRIIVESKKIEVLEKKVNHLIKENGIPEGMSLLEQYHDPVTMK